MSPERLKVVYLSPSGSLGGAERSLLDFLASVKAAEPDWALTLIATEHGGLVRAATELGVATTVLPMPSSLGRLGDAAAGGPAGWHLSVRTLLGRLLVASPAALGYVLRLRRAMVGLQPDLAHANGFKMHILSAWAQPAGLPLVWHVHDYVRARPVMGPLLRAHARRCAAAVANSVSVAQDLRETVGPRIRVVAIRNGVDLERFSPAGRKLDLDRVARLGPASPSTLRVGLVATTARWKGHQAFLQALALLPGGLEVRGYVIGGALYRTEGSQYDLDELRLVAAELGLAERVGFTGFIDDVPAAMRALDVVVHASTEPEPFGLVIAEAMACGRPVVVSRAGGATEIISPGIDALAYEPGDAAALARLVAKLAADPGLRLALGKSARASAERRFARARLAAELVPLYREIVAGAS